MIRLALLLGHVAAYRIASFSELAKVGGIELMVVFMSDRSWPHGIPVDLSGAEFDYHLPRTGENGELSAIRAIRNHRPHVTVVGGWNRLAYQAALWSRPLLGRTLLWVTSTSRDLRRPRWWKTVIKRAALKRADAVIVPGSAARRYCETLMPGRQLYVVAPSAIENDKFRRASENDGVRSSAGVVFLYVGRLDHGKGVDVLLEAWRMVEDQITGELWLAGGGSLGPQLSRHATSLGLQRARFLGHRSYEELPEVYGSADVFVFPSLADTWGMVVNEAMASRLPVICTSTTAAGEELVREGINGLIVPPGDAGALASAMLQLGENRSLRSRMAQASERLIRDVTPRQWALRVAELASVVAAGG